MLRAIMNVIWLVLSGIWLALGYALAGVVMFILIITIPFGVQAFKLAGYSLWPFGRENRAPLRGHSRARYVPRRPSATDSASRRAAGRRTGSARRA